MTALRQTKESQSVFWIKAIARGSGMLVAMPYGLAYEFIRRVLGADRAFVTTVESIAKRSGFLGIYARQAFYRRLLKHVGNDVHFGFLSFVSKRQAVIGNRVYIGRFCSLGNVDLGDEVILADGVQILSGRHQHGDVLVVGQSWHQNPLQFNRVKIGSGAWIGAGAIVMADVGANAVVGAGAVVVHPIPAGQKVGGVPAMPLRRHAAA